MNVRLPLDNAWDAAVTHLMHDELVGSAVVKLNQYNVGQRANYVLIASNGLGGKREIHVAVELDEECDRPHVQEPAKPFWLSKRYIGIPVQNAHQAGAVIHVVEDAGRNGVSAVQAINYVAERWK